jgi:hypothetical protein
MSKPDPGSNKDVKTANLALMALSGRFAFVVLFISFCMNNADDHPLGFTAVINQRAVSR